VAPPSRSAWILAARALRCAEGSAIFPATSGVVRDGRLVAVEEVEALRKRAVRRVEIRFDAPVPADAFTGLPNVRDVQVAGTLLRCLLSGPADPLVKAAARFTSQSLLAEEPDHRGDRRDVLVLLSVGSPTGVRVRQQLAAPPPGAGRRHSQEQPRSPC
jgi:hypothetical protein